MMAKFFSKILPVFLSLLIPFVSLFSLPPVAAAQEATSTTEDTGYVIGGDQVITSTTTSNIVASGTKSVAVYYVTFLDYPTRNMGNSDVSDYFNVDFNNLLAKSSHGKLQVNATVYPVNMSINLKCEELNNMAVEAKRAAMDQFFVNSDNYDMNAIIFDRGCVAVGKRGGQAQQGTPHGFFYSEGFSAVAHEFGHMLGLSHANSYDCGDVTVREGCALPTQENGGLYGDFTDLMGKDIYLPYEYGPYAKDSLGWFNPGELLELSNSQPGTYRLNKYEDPNSGQKVIKIRTFSGGPVYYLAYKKDFITPPDTADGPYLFLASSNLSARASTWLLDLTPNSGTNSDFNDSYLHVGQTWQDPFNGITLRGVAKTDGYFDVEVTFVYPTVNSATMKVSWPKPNGYLEGVGNKKEINSWPAVHYLVDFKCSYGAYCANSWNQWVTPPGCSGWPTGSCPPFDTTNNSIDVLVSAGFRYQYQVWILVRDDSNPNAYRPYLWIGETEVNNSCGGGTCSLNISWPKVTYRVSLFKDADGSGVCSINHLGCQELITTQDVAKVTFSGIPAGVDMYGEVRINDFSGASHLLSQIPGLGPADQYVRSCTGQNSCQLNPLSFIGFEKFTETVRLRDPYGVVTFGPEDAYAQVDGSFFEAWGFDYVAVAYPKGGDCYSAGDKCRIVYVYSSSTNPSVTFEGLLPGQEYSYKICAETCNAPPGQNSVITSGSDWSNGSISMDFFDYDPFAPDAELPYNQYKADYFDNEDFTNVRLTRFDSKVDFNWGSGSPDPSIAPDTFSVRWTGNFNFDSAAYRFITTRDEFLRLYVDDMTTPLIDAWGGGNLNLAVKQMSAGVHKVKVEYRENTGNASVKSLWVKAYTCADVNGDLRITSGDQLLVKQHFGMQGFTPWDVTGDKWVNSGDMLKLYINFHKYCT